MLVNGEWSADWDPVQAKDSKGGFKRQDSEFRNWIGDEQFPAEKERYRLYAAYICPWACRTLALRNLKGLQDIIPVTIINPVMTDFGWQFGGYPGASAEDPEMNAQYMHELYTKANGNYTGRATVPVLWDTKAKTIVNNESSEIIKMLNSAFDDLLPENYQALNFYPEALKDDIDRFNADIYPSVNNGVYRAGFATTQEAYEEAFADIFAKLDDLEDRFSDGRKFVHGERLTLSDIHLFVTLIRFDVAYYGLFKTNLRRIEDYPHLQAYTKRMYSEPSIVNTVNFDHIKSGYYSIKKLNPTGIVPKGPSLQFE